MKTPGFSAEVLVHSGIQNRHYGGLFTPSAQGGVSPQLAISDVDKILGLIYEAASAVVAGIGGGFQKGGAFAAHVATEAACLVKTGRFCD